MFVYYFAHIDSPVDEATEILVNLLDGIADDADIAYRVGESLLMRAGPESPIAKTVTLSVGSLFRLNEESVIPLAWEATGPTRLFPKLDAELRLASVSAELSKLSLEGSYHPPLGPVGRTLDRLLLHRVAEATIKNFVDRIGEALVGWPRMAKEDAIR